MNTPAFPTSPSRSLDQYEQERVGSEVLTVIIFLVSRWVSYTARVMEWLEMQLHTEFSPVDFPAFSIAGKSYIVEKGAPFI